MFTVLKRTNEEYILDMEQTIIKVNSFNRNVEVAAREIFADFTNGNWKVYFKPNIKDLLYYVDMFLPCYIYQP